VVDAACIAAEAEVAPEAHDLEVRALAARRSSAARMESSALPSSTSTIS